MTTQDTAFNLELSRRKLLAAAGIAGGAAVAASLIGTDAALAAPAAAPSSDQLTPPPVTGLHPQFGADASSKMVVSWHTLQSVRNPRVILGTLNGQLDRVVAAKETSYTDAKSGQVVWAYHAKIGQMRADSSCLYGASHEGAAPEFGTFRTAPRRRAVHVHQLRGSGHADFGQEVPAARRGDDCQAAICERRSRLAGGCRYGSRRRTGAALVSPAQWRSLLRQRRRGSGRDLVGFLGEQQPQRSQASLLGWTAPYGIECARL